MTFEEKLFKRFFTAKDAKSRKAAQREAPNYHNH